MSKALCHLAFESLYSNLNHTQAIPFEAFEDSSAAMQNEDFPPRAPLFITWNKDNNLRGCIGTFQKQPVLDGVTQYALVAALEDTRFNPISKLELNSLISVSVTLLDNFTVINSWDDWTVGENGLKVAFRIGGQQYLGTFLPLVAEEEEWDQLTTLYYLLRKSNYDKVPKASVAAFYTKGTQEGWLVLTRYDGLKLSLDYDEFVEVRKGLK